MNRREALQILDMQEGFDSETLKKKYREAAKKYHPDLGGSLEQMKLVNEAQELLEKQLKEGYIPKSEYKKQSGPFGYDVYTHKNRAYTTINIDDVLEEFFRRMREEQRRAQEEYEAQRRKRSKNFQNRVYQYKNNIGEMVNNIKKYTKYTYINNRNYNRYKKMTKNFAIAIIVLMTGVMISSLISLNISVVTKIATITLGIIPCIKFIIKKINQMFSNTNYAKYRITIFIGEDYDYKEIKLNITNETINIANNIFENILINEYKDFINNWEKIITQSTIFTEIDGIETLEYFKKHNNSFSTDSNFGIFHANKKIVHCRLNKRGDYLIVIPGFIIITDKENSRVIPTSGIKARVIPSKYLYDSVEVYREKNGQKEVIFTLHSSNEIDDISYLFI